MGVEVSDGLEIRPARTVDEYRACQEAQRLAWGINEDSYVVPVATMVGAQLHGGLVLGAFLPSGEAVGLSFAFLGEIGGRVGLYSQLTGVVPGYQSRGVGRQLKLAQFAFARERALPVVAWAFDPLQAGNARFNLDKLGATAGRYVDNMYGERTDALNAGVPTDRLIAEWRPDAPESPKYDPGQIVNAPRRIATQRRPDGLIEPGVVESRSDGPIGLLEVPESIQALRAADPELAESWRKAVRGAFLQAFSDGDRAVGFHREPADADNRRRGYYVLMRHAT